MNANDFSKLDAQSETSAFAKMTAEEHVEFQSYLDERNSQLDAELGIELICCGICDGNHRTADCTIPDGEEPDSNVDDTESCDLTVDGEDCFPYNVHDLSDDADALASAGLGTDEDYNPAESVDSMADYDSYWSE